MRVRLLPPARRDLRDIRDHIAREHPSGDIRVISSILDRIEQLGVLPRAGPLRPDIGRDVRLTVEWPYLILYRIEGEEVWVVRILHGARRITRGLLPPSPGS